MSKNRRNWQPQYSGFTLIEVMVVLIIIVFIAGLGVRAVQGQMEKARIKAAKAYIKTLEGAVDNYAVEVGRPPTTDQGLGALVNLPSDIPNPDDWGGPYLKDTATSTDPWGSPYQYVSPGARSNHSFEIWSFGPDRRDGTDDDIESWAPNR